MRNFIQILEDAKQGFIPEIQKITNEYLYKKTPKLFDKSITQPIPLSNYRFFDTGPKYRNDLQYGIPEWHARNKELLNNLQNDILNVKKEYIEKAKKEFNRIKSTLKMIKMTTGEYRFVKANRPAIISTFKVPNSYLQKVLHADRPLPDNLIEIIRKIYQRTHPGFANDSNYKLDLRSLKPKKNRTNEFETFDNWIENYKKYGSRYAWTDDNKKVGGKGENPSLDVFMNGTHSGFHAFLKSRETQTAFIKDMMAAGYVGLEYDGGTKITGTGNRGGGKNYHRAFVFWDDKTLNSFRVENHPHQDDDIEMKRNPRWDTVPLR